MTPASPRIRSILLLSALALGGAGCGKDSKGPDKGKTEDTSGTAKGPAPADQPPVLSARKLPNLPLQADVADTWKLEEDKVAPEGGARLSTATGEVSIMKDGVGGFDSVCVAIVPADASCPHTYPRRRLATGA